IFIFFGSQNLLALDFSSFKNTVTRNADPLIFKRVYASFGESVGYLVASDNANIFYSLSSSGAIVGYYNFSENKVDGWKLGAPDPCDDEDDPDCSIPWWYGRWGS